MGYHALVGLLAVMLAGCSDSLRSAEQPVDEAQPGAGNGALQSAADCARTDRTLTSLPQDALHEGFAAGELLEALAGTWKSAEGAELSISTSRPYTRVSFEGMLVPSGTRPRDCAFQDHLVVAATVGVRDDSTGLALEFDTQIELREFGATLAHDPTPKAFIGAQPPPVEGTLRVSGHFQLDPISGMTPAWSISGVITAPETAAANGGVSGSMEIAFSFDLTEQSANPATSDADG